MKVSKLVDLALKQLGVLAAGENAKSDEVADAVDSLRGLLAQWATDRLFVYKAQTVVMPLTRGKGAYLVGSIDECCCDQNDNCYTGPIPDLDIDISLVAEKAWLDDCEIKLIRDLNNTGINIKVTYQEDKPFWTFNVLDDAQNLKIKVYSLPSDICATDELTFPDKYQRALILSLALEIAPMFAVEPSALLLRNQNSAIDLLKRSNSTPTYAKNDLPVGICRGWHYGRYY
ncbi:hypothetical protein [Acinetobacter sp. Ac_5812]|uniref:hypothetical protein n=1 Tax=Acinetobacter sp. Ac_5812 TaxID=1848937 RepID=UPI0014902434|nr:hypothetical protein [Acinetobacter sp. Ac_5812]NNP70934.1 hypothetical protein [Acinetobacter sp. Ac_5812]